MEFAKKIAPDRPILIAGATASGKSALALALAEKWGGQIINADALQVYDGWRLLTARPSAADEDRWPHHLYGHVSFLGDYSVGAWLRDLAPLLRTGPRPIIVGGTGLYFRALTEGLAEIPPVQQAVRIAADGLSHAALLADLEQSDPMIYAKIDLQNRARVQRAWEVWRATGKPLSRWQAETPAPLLPLDQAAAFKLIADRDWLNDRIAHRFHSMIKEGALDEARAALPHWAQVQGAAKAIGAPELIAHLRGDISLETAIEAAIIASRQYAKRQRTWLRAQSTGWTDLYIPI
ncbi:tRNA (adenosine(37)-N6)-dimethylallyltransferase MiaA [Rhodobacterales bacterium LSUCC0387]|nr:tRNA (adenosine(37)-N6)-dimethylallyltransferase MiaA [Rhodobacterales bacterium LSUCC0374]MBF9040555.1 tRNA (adenosine(37)-N6)-dimethylallyltransferase MiaA [Rhodobacterales bacterium LSUCC0387]